MKKNNDTSHERTTRIFPLTRKPLSLRVRPDTCQAETQVLEAREQLLDLERPSASASAKRPGARRPARGRHMGTYGFRTCGRERRFSDWSPTRLAPGPGDPRETGGAREPREPYRAEMWGVHSARPPAGPARRRRRGPHWRHLERLLPCRSKTHTCTSVPAASAPHPMPCSNSLKHTSPAPRDKQ